MRRALILLFVAVVALLAGVPAAHAATVTVTISNDKVPKTVNVPTGDDVLWHNDDDHTHTLIFDGRDPITVEPGKNSESITVDADIEYKLDDPTSDTIFTIHAVAPASTTTTTTTTNTTTTASSTTTTSTSTSTTTTTTSTTTTTTLASASGSVAVSDKGGGSSSAAPLLIGAILVVGALAGGAYWLWWRSGTAADEEEDHWEQGPPTAQGPTV